MEKHGQKIVVVGAGIAGLCAAVYGLKCGYDVEVLEMHDMAGGLAMSWKRGAYRFETCLHWLVGSRPGGDFHDQWQEVCDIDQLMFANQDEFVRLETEDGDTLRLYTDVDRLEAELLQRAPQNASAIMEFTRAVRTLGKFRMLDPAGGLKENWLNMLRDIPVFPLMGRLSKISGADYGKQFQDPLLRRFFTNGDIGKLTAMAMVFSLGLMNVGNAGYCTGGAQSLIRLIEEKIASLGGKIRFNARVERVLVENDTAVGVELKGGERVMADWVMSAADGRTTIFEMLGGKYVDEETQKRYDERELFASYLQVSLGVAKDLSDEPAMLSRILLSPLVVDPATEVDSVSFRIFHFDPTFAPPGKTAVTCTLPTRNFTYWNDLRKMDLGCYHREKQRVAEAVIGVLEKRIPGVRQAIEIVDVSTPATVYRYTGNWKGTMEGWLVEPGDSFKPLRNTLPGLKRFVMAGQWAMPGGGLPSGPMTAKPAVKWICKQDHVHFDVHTEPAAETVAV